MSANIAGTGANTDGEVPVGFHPCMALHGPGADYKHINQRMSLHDFNHIYPVVNQISSY